MRELEFCMDSATSPSSSAICHLPGDKKVLFPGRRMAETENTFPTISSIQSAIGVLSENFDKKYKEGTP